MDAEDGPEGLGPSFTLVRVRFGCNTKYYSYSIPALEAYCTFAHFGRKLVQGGLDQLPPIRGWFSAFADFRHVSNDQFNIARMKFGMTNDTVIYHHKVRVVKNRKIMK